ncbi:DUF2867 domain-containing protein [Actinocatenispora sera]|jgi:hypothetical protein|uniref:Uncharacterized protein n=1 Tax=Actinocatenispora sera TaxID=390989 RepID=A0A810L3C7_9ACTN|nr:DUF2867 domain-containing protein [Actinocatenispora sera]BCJ28658.1 hypothetical protein Asera_27660 [Actinocatenispora sera]
MISARHDAGVDTLVLESDDRVGIRPHGFAGRAYWKLISPFHDVVFGGMAANITGAAERES